MHTYNAWHSFIRRDRLRAWEEIGNPTTGWGVPYGTTQDHYMYMSNTRFRALKSKMSRMIKLFQWHKEGLLAVTQQFYQHQHSGYPHVPKPKIIRLIRMRPPGKQKDTKRAVECCFRFLWTKFYCILSIGNAFQSCSSTRANCWRTLLIWWSGWDIKRIFRSPPNDVPWFVDSFHLCILLIYCTCCLPNHDEAR